MRRLLYVALENYIRDITCLSFGIAPSVVLGLDHLLDRCKHRGFGVILLKTKKYRFSNKRL